MTDGCGDAQHVRAQKVFGIQRSSQTQSWRFVKSSISYTSGLKNSTHSFPRRHCKFASESTIVDWENFVRDICRENFLRHPVAIGGVGHVVEIDESAWTKRKYNRGCVASTRWVFEGADRDTGKCFAALVERHDATTLLPIIRGGVTERLSSQNWFEHPQIFLRISY